MASCPKRLWITSNVWWILSMITHRPSAPVPYAEKRAKHVVIIGGGITGLSAAWALQQKAAEEDVTLRYTLLESSDRWGGKAQTEQIDSDGDQPFVLEAGPDAFLTRKPWAYALAQELGLSDRIQSVNRENNKTFILHRGLPVPLPEGLQLLVPTKIGAFLRSPLFSWAGKIRALFDLVIPKRQQAGDETLANFVRRRLGPEILDKVAEPLLGGVYNGDSEQQSIEATFPQFPALEQKSGSLIRGMWAAQGESKPSSVPPFISFHTGTHELIDTLVSRLAGEKRLNAPVQRIERTENNRYRVVANELFYETDAVILATPAFVTATLLREIAPESAAQIDTIPYVGIGSAYFAFLRDSVPHPLNGFGLVVPASEQRPIDGITWTSSKWDRRAPTDTVLLRVFFGGPRSKDTLTLDDDALRQVLRNELHSLFGITDAPLFTCIYRWREGYPQYTVGHLERLAEAESALPEGVFLAGSAYRGVGVPDCVRQGQEAAQKALALVETMTDHA
jgi:protoporphyrinogen/coproporphyrinogen III oxidase